MKSIFEFFLKNKLIVNMLTIVILLVGGYSFLHLKQDEMPTSDLNIMIVSVIYPGASAEDVEINAVEPIERAIEKINGIDTYTSLVMENMASISIELDEDVDDLRSVKDEVFRNISISGIPELPAEVEDITIVDLNPDRKSIMQFVVYPLDSTVGEGKLYAYIDLLEDQLLEVEGVGEIRKQGYRDREIHIDVDPVKAKKLNVSLNQIVASIGTRNIRSTGGTIQSLTSEKTIVTIGQFDDPMDVGDVIIRSNFAGKMVRVSDLAKVVDSFKDVSTRVTVNGRPGVVLEIVKKENSDVVRTADNVRAFVERNNDADSKKFSMEIVKDSSVSIKSLLSVVNSNAILGFILVLIILLIFLDKRTAFWTAFGLPIIMAIAFAYMYATDISLNRISLIAIIAVLGMLVDDGIVIAEMIYKNKRKGMAPLQAAYKGTVDVLPAVTVSIFTTIVAFLPMLTIGGIMGKFISIFPIIVTAMLLASLFEATFMLPNHLNHKQKKKVNISDWFDPIRHGYKKFLRVVLRFRYIVVFLFVAAFILSIGFSRETISNFTLMPTSESDVIYIDLEAPQGTRLDYMTEYTTEIEKLVQNIVPPSALMSTKSSIGKHESNFLGGKGNYEHWSTVMINLVPVNERETTAREIKAKLTKGLKLEDYPHLTKLQVIERKMGPPAGEPVDIKVIGDDYEEILKMVDELETYLKSVDGVFNVQNDMLTGKEELKITFKYEELAKLGLTVQDVAKTVRTAYDGTEATSIETGDGILDFRVKVDDSFQKDQEYLLSLTIPNNQGRLILLSEVAYIVERQGMANINHYEGNRVVAVNAKTDNEVITSAQANILAKDFYKTIENKYPGVRIEIEGEAKQTTETMGDIFSAYLLAILLIFFVLVLLFKSLSQPLLVLLVVPFGIIGSLIGFTIHGLPLSFMGAIGIIGLSGVVVNDSVLMIDFINGVFRGTEGKQDKKRIISNIADGASQRLRAVLMTTVTTVAGLLPTVYGFLGETEIIAPVALAMAYGLMFATFITLIFTPAIYMVNEDIRGLFRRSPKALKENENA